MSRFLEDPSKYMSKNSASGCTISEMHRRSVVLGPSTAYPVWPDESFTHFKDCFAFNTYLDPPSIHAVTVNQEMICRHVLTSMAVRLYADI